MTTLFESHDLAGLRLPNRVVMAPMARVRSNPEGLATPSMATYYAQRASAGLIVTEGIQPNVVGQSAPLTPGLHTDAQADSWRQVTDAVHVNGGRIFAQLMHSGRMSHPSTTGLQPVGPSAIAPRDAMVFTTSGLQPAPVPRALSTDEAAAEALSYAAAARRAMTAGFDGVELHGANGYLISQFLAPSSNVRTDRYGGPVANRVRFAVEAVTATAEAVGAHRVGLRLLPGGGLGDTVDEDVLATYGELLDQLAPLGLAYVHLVANAGGAVVEPLIRRWPGTVVVNPSVDFAKAPTDGDLAQRWLDRGADLVSFGRSFLANPDLVERLRTRAPLAVGDQETFYQGGDRGYLDYPTYRAS
jgi:N-ethylmaleimide reductase